MLFGVFAVVVLVVDDITVIVFKMAAARSATNQLFQLLHYWCFSFSQFLSCAINNFAMCSFYAYFILFPPRAVFVILSRSQFVAFSSYCL